MRVVLVHNPGAGDAIHSRASLARLIRNAGHSVEDFSSKDERWHLAVETRADLVAAAGGDGTVAEVARALAGRAVPIAVLPFGTANNIACALGQDLTPIDALVAGWKDAARQPFDLGIANGAWGRFGFLESVGAGLLAETMAAIEEGHAGYVNELDDPAERIAAAFGAFEQTLRQVPARPFGIWIDGRDVSGEYVLVEAMNFGAAGPNLRLAPDAGPSDGLLDLVLVDDAMRHGLMDRLLLYRDDPANAPELPVIKGRDLRIRCEPIRVHLDDELRMLEPGCGDLLLTVLPGAISFLVPVVEGSRVC